MEQRIVDQCGFAGTGYAGDDHEALQGELRTGVPEVVQLRAGDLQHRLLDLGEIRRGEVAREELPANLGQRSIFRPQRVQAVGGEFGVDLETEPSLAECDDVMALAVLGRRDAEAPAALDQRRTCVRQMRRVEQVVSQSISGSWMTLRPGLYRFGSVERVGWFTTLRTRCVA